MGWQGLVLSDSKIYLWVPNFGRVVSCDFTRSIMAAHNVNHISILSEKMWEWRLGVPCNRQAEWKCCLKPNNFDRAFQECFREIRRKILKTTLRDLVLHQLEKLVSRMGRALVRWHPVRKMWKGPRATSITKDNLQHNQNFEIMLRSRKDSLFLLYTVNTLEWL